MSSLKPLEEHVEKAFRLAYFISGSQQRAVSIVSAALNKLEVAATAQFKRLYYTPARRKASGPAGAESHRTKITLSELHLLQRLIYIESEPYERALEELQDQDEPTEATMLVHFIKHLVRITIKRNSFYVTLGISRLLHNYSTVETMEIYNVAVQDPERVKDDYYYRSRKGRLIQEMKERFGSLINVARGARGEERFQTHEAPEEFTELVRECLGQFAPWNTQCSVPPVFDPLKDELRPLAFKGGDDEDRVEINRIHAVLHPRCYERIAQALRLELPERRLDIPHFFLPSGKNNMKRPGHQHQRDLSSLSPDELEVIKGTLARESARRKTTHAPLLSIVVDDRERARLDLKRSGSVKLDLEDGDELLEVRALKQDQETLLASHLLCDAEAMDASAAPQVSEIVLEGGQRIRFTLAPAATGPINESSTRVIQISYQETHWLRAASLQAQRAMLRLSEALDAKGTLAGSSLKGALAGLLLLLCAGGLLLFIMRGVRRDVPAREEVASAVGPDTLNAAQAPLNAQPTPLSAVQNPRALPSPTGLAGSLDQKRDDAREAATAGEAGSRRGTLGQRERDAGGRVARRAAFAQETAATRDIPSRNIPERPTSSPPGVSSGAGGASTDEASPASKTARTRNGEDATGDLTINATRALMDKSEAARLSKVRKIYLDIQGQEELVQQSGRLIARGLQASADGPSITSSKDEADAALKLSVRETTPRSSLQGVDEREAVDRLHVSVSVRLINEDGEVIWPTQRSKTAGRYSGRLDSIMKRMVQDILQDILQDSHRARPKQKG